MPWPALAKILIVSTPRRISSRDEPPQLVRPVARQVHPGGVGTSPPGVLVVHVAGRADVVAAGPDARPRMMPSPIAILSWASMSRAGGAGVPGRTPLSSSTRQVRTPMAIITPGGRSRPGRRPLVELVLVEVGVEVARDQPGEQGQPLQVDHVAVPARLRRRRRTRSLRLAG